MRRSFRRDVTFVAALALSALFACSSKRPVREPARTAPRAVAVAHDPALLTCKTVAQSEAPDYCGALEKAPRGESVAATKVLEIWKRLEGPFHAMTGRESALVVLGPDARSGEGSDAEPLMPAAYICPGAPPTVYVPDSLVQLIDNADPTKYPDDFLAFVIGHELGHRMNDLTPDGCQLAAFQRPGNGDFEEELADARAAFFITSAGFSATKIARADLVSRFLEGEYELGREVTKLRRASLLGALQQFDAYEALYQAGLNLALTGDKERADRVLSWADELVRSHGVLLPELRVARAIVRINRVADDRAKPVPWTDELGIDLEGFRCSVLHPSHSSLWERPPTPLENAGGGGGSETDPRTLLREALALLDEAEALGGTPFTIATARTCATLYLADANGAAAAQARAESLVPLDANHEVTELLASNRWLVTFLAYVRNHPVPKQPAEHDAWHATLVTTLGDAAPPATRARLKSRFSSPNGWGLTIPTVAKPTHCADVTARSAAWGQLFPTRPSHLVDGHCPPSTALVHALTTGGTDTKRVVTVCRGTTSADAVITLRMDDDQITVRTHRVPPELDKLETWACLCQPIMLRGLSDQGQAVFGTRCSSLDLGRVTLIADDAKVLEIVDDPFN
jgi:hypothetical protein